MNDFSLSFAAATPIPSPSHGEPAASSRDAFSSRDAPYSCIWNPCSQSCRGNLGREQYSRGEGKLEVVLMSSVGFLVPVGLLRKDTRIFLFFL